MRLLVTGANGVVGAALVQASADLGWEVVAFDRSEAPPELLRTWSAASGKIRPVQGDVGDPAALKRAFSVGPIEGVIHAATVTSAAQREAATPELVLGVNVIGTIHVLQASRQASVGRFIYVSSNAVYGSNALSWPHLDEATTACDPTALYGISKLAAERTALRLGELWGSDIRVARLSSVFGPWERDTGVRDTLNPMLQVTLLALRSGEAILERPCRRDWIYNRDVASALIELMRSTRLRHATYNIGPGPGRDWAVTDWCRRLATEFPNFRYRLAEEGEAPNVALHEPADRAPLNTARLFADTDFRPSYGIEPAFQDMMRWIKENQRIVS